MPPILPMLAKSVKGVPTTSGLSFEPKWDARRQVVFQPAQR